MSTVVALEQSIERRIIDLVAGYRLLLQQVAANEQKGETALSPCQCAPRGAAGSGRPRRCKTASPTAVGPSSAAEGRVHLPISRTIPSSVKNITSSGGDDRGRLYTATQPTRLATTSKGRNSDSCPMTATTRRPQTSHTLHQRSSAIIKTQQLHTCRPMTGGKCPRVYCAACSGYSSTKHTTFVHRDAVHDIALHTKKKSAA